MEWMTQKGDKKKGMDEEILWKRNDVTPLGEGGTPRWVVKESSLEVLTQSR